jgi:hypothetical protein
MMSQSIALSKRPHIIVATPGRLMDHLENTKGFSLKSLKYLILDEADRLLDMDFGPIIDKILKIIPKERNTYLFSATMTTKVAKLQRASLNKPVRVEVSNKYVPLPLSLWRNENPNLQILNGFDPAPTLPSSASQIEGCSPALPCQRAVILINDNLHTDGQ